MDRETGNQGTTTQSPTRIHISHLINPNNWTYSLLSCCQAQGFMAAQRSCFIKQGRPAVAFHTIVRRRTRCIPTTDQTLCPIGISRGKAASKADSAPPMSHSGRALLGMYCLVQGQGCRVLRLPLYITKRQLGAFLAHFLLFTYIFYTKFCATSYSHCLIKVQKVLLRFSFLLFSLSLTILTP